MMKKIVFIAGGLLLLCGIVFGLVFRFVDLPGLIGQPSETSQVLFEGITYTREVRSEPRDMVIHIVTIDLKAKGIKVLVTPGEEGNELPLKARTTSEFLEDFELQLAVNGDAFYPWSVVGPFYTPHSGDRVNVYGYAASRGTIYSQESDTSPTLYIYQNNKASINSVIGKMYNAVSGTATLVRRGKAVIEFGDEAQPRTAVGLNQSGRRLTIVVVDGRQPGFSEGATLKEMAQILVDQRVYMGFNLDGGGSSTLVMEGEDGMPELLNSPIHIRIAGNERPVGNHLGIYARKRD
jgi:hypothetical protein